MRCQPTHCTRVAIQQKTIGRVYKQTQLAQEQQSHQAIYVYAHWRSDQPDQTQHTCSGHVYRFLARLGCWQAQLVQLLGFHMPHATVAPQDAQWCTAISKVPTHITPAVVHMQADCSHHRTEMPNDTSSGVSAVLATKQGAACCCITCDQHNSSHSIPLDAVAG
jgi:hypothetical protein